jgi:hypothetical protein
MFLSSLFFSVMILRESQGVVRKLLAESGKKRNDFDPRDFEFGGECELSYRLKIEK